MRKPIGVLLDTHVWLQYVSCSALVKPSTVAVIEDARISGLVFVSVISVWEIAMLVRLQRLILNASVKDWIAQALSLPGVNLLGLTPQIAIDSVDLRDPMHKDPADRIVVATARHERLTLITRDRAILSSARTVGLTCLRA